MNRPEGPECASGVTTRRGDNGSMLESPGYSLTDRALNNRLKNGGPRVGPALMGGRQDVENGKLPRLLWLMAAVACGGTTEAGERAAKGGSGQGGATDRALGGTTGQNVGGTAPASGGSLSTAGSIVSDAGAPGSSTGGMGLGGAIATGGTVPMLQGGNAGANTALDETCVWPEVKFEFTVDDPTAFCQTSHSLARMADIYTIDGQYVTFLPSYSGYVDVSPFRQRCPRCGQSGHFDLAPMQSPLTNLPLTASWLGDREEIQHCSTFANFECGIRRCVAQGRYVARFCLAPKGNAPTCSITNQAAFLPITACVDVPFDLPATEVVRGTLTKAMIPGAAGAADAAANGGTAGSAGAPGNAGGAGRLW